MAELKLDSAQRGQEAGRRRGLVEAGQNIQLVGQGGDIPLVDELAPVQTLQNLLPHGKGFLNEGLVRH